MELHNVFIAGSVLGLHTVFISAKFCPKPTGIDEHLSPSSLRSGPHRGWRLPFPSARASNSRPASVLSLVMGVPSGRASTNLCVPSGRARTNPGRDTLFAALATLPAHATYRRISEFGVLRARGLTSAGSTLSPVPRRQSC